MFLIIDKVMKSKISQIWFAIMVPSPFAQDISRPFVMLCAIWYHLYNSKNTKNANGIK